MNQSFSEILTALATFFAAVSTFLAFLVSKNSNEFQKNFALNQHLTVRIRESIENLWLLNEIIINPLEQNDEKFESSVPIFKITKYELNQIFNNRKPSQNITKFCTFKNIDELVFYIANNVEFIPKTIKELEIEIINLFGTETFSSKLKKFVKKLKNDIKKTAIK